MRLIHCLILLGICAGPEAFIAAVVSVAGVSVVVVAKTTRVVFEVPKRNASLNGSPSVRF